MGKLDTFAKTVFNEETKRLTAGACQWQGSREISIGDHVLPDGFLLVGEPAKLKALPPPWSLIEEDELLLEIKMAGDHMGPKQWYRGLLRRAARDVERCEAEDEEWVEHVPLWFVASNLPAWIQKPYVVIPKHKGCYLITGWPYPIFWIAANELPLVEPLIPFLVARRNKPREAFARWVSRRRSPVWVSRMLRAYNMTEAELKEQLKFLGPDDKEDEEWNTMFARLLLKDVVPNVREELIAEGEHQLLLRLFEKRLKRPLTEDERATVLSRIESLGAERLDDIFIESSAEELATWLAASDAT